MKLQLATEWFLNPDHLPFIVGIQQGIFQKYGIDLEIIVPTEHYDGLDELLKGNIHFATNEPLHLIEQFDDNFLSLGTYFETQGGVMMKKESFDKLKNGEMITVTTPVSNDVTNTIGFEIIKRFYENHNVEITREQVHFAPNGFEHIKYMKEGADAGWLYFYNFEGIEAKHEEMDVIFMDAETAGFANFSALDLFVNKQFYHDNREICENFNAAVKEAITWLENNNETAMDDYYAYTSEDASPLMDDILKDTMGRFDAHYASEAEKSAPILHFFNEIGVTNLSEEKFHTAFLK